MRELEIKLMGRQYSGQTVVSVDGNPVKFKKNKFGNLVCNYRTENDIANIKVYTLLDVGGIFWFLTQIFFFLISIFGIFDIHRKQKCFVIDFEIDLYLQEYNSVTLKLIVPKEDEKAIEVQTDLSGQGVANRYFLDTKAKKILKALKLTKLFLTLAIIATVIALIVINL